MTFQTLRSSRCIPDYSPSCIPDYVSDNHFDYIPDYVPDHQTKTQGVDIGSDVMLQAVEGFKAGKERKCFLGISREASRDQMYLLGMCRFGKSNLK